MVKITTRKPTEYEIALHKLTTWHDTGIIPTTTLHKRRIKKGLKLEYQTWIEQNYPTYESAYGHCKEATERMQMAFPELKLVKGHYYCSQWGKRGHFWCEDENGIVDPTAIQFPTKGNGSYEPWIEGNEEPTGICANCGEDTYNYKTCCSESCNQSYVAYCNSLI